MVVLVLVVGAVLALSGAGLVYVDATRREMQLSRRLSWAMSIGTVGFGGFLLPYVYADAFRRAYLGVKPAPVVVSPYEIVVLHAVVGTAIVATAVLLYAFRRQPASRRVP